MYSKYKIFIFIFFISFSWVFAQSRVALSFSQAMSEDWKEGVKKSFETNMSLEGKYSFPIDTLELQINFKAALGAQIRKDESEIKDAVLPTDNELFGESILVYPAGWTINPYISSSFRTQITESFRLVGNKLTRSANLWDPVTSQQSAGFTYTYTEKKNLC